MNENVTVCITPKGDKPVLHFSQFDNERVFTVTVLADDGKTAAVLTGLNIEFRLRKTDSHVVTIAPKSVADNVITFKTTEQMCACCGQNIASVVLMKDDMNIATLDILVDIQRDILSGGLTSESDIRNLTTQIEQIVPEVIDDDYYNKQEVDALIAEHTFDPTNYYDKSEVYNKTETDNLLSAKMDNIAYNGIVDDVAIMSFNTDSIAPLAIIKGKITPVQSGTGTPSPSNPRPISGFSALNVTLADGDMQTVDTKTVNFGQTVYGGVADVTNGNCIVSYGLITLTGQEAGASYDWGGYTFNNPLFEGSNNDIEIIKCSHTDDLIKGIDFFNSRDLGHNVSCTISTYSNVRFRNRSVGSTLADYQAWLKQQVTNGTPVQIVAKLATPIEITTTPETVLSIAGDNNIFLDTGNLTEIAYFEGVDDNLSKLLKAYHIL